MPVANNELNTPPAVVLLSGGLDSQLSICSVDTTWGYFSGKDLEKHEFDLCEECYDRITLSFAVPPEISEDTEV